MLTTQQFILLFLLWYCRSSALEDEEEEEKFFRWTAEFYSCRWAAGPGFALFAVFAGLVSVCLSRLGLGHQLWMSRLTIESGWRIKQRFIREGNLSRRGSNSISPVPETTRDRQSHILTNATALRMPEASRTNRILTDRILRQGLWFKSRFWTSGIRWIKAGPCWGHATCIPS